MGSLKGRRLASKGGQQPGAECPGQQHGRPVGEDTAGHHREHAAGVLQQLCNRTRILCKDIYNQLKQAEAQVKMGNTMWGSQVIKSIIHSDQRTPEEKEAYQKIYANVTSSYYDTNQ